MKSILTSRIDLILVFSVLILIVIGVLFIYSSGVTASGIVFSNEYIKQIIWAAIGFSLMIGLIFIDYSVLRDLSLYIYLIFIVLLAITALFGKYVNGAKSWIGIWELGVQPSEFSKIAVILFLANYLATNRKTVDTIKTFALSLGIVIVPVFCILLQPDLGTAMVFFPIFFFMILSIGGKIRHSLFLLLSGGLIIIFTVLPAVDAYLLNETPVIIRLFIEKRLYTVFIITVFSLLAISLLAFYATRRSFFYWNVYTLSCILISFGASLLARKVIKGYQLMRLIVFLNPNVDPRGAGWNIIQSVTAVGSGGIFGKGFLQGTQSHYQYLPQQSTDFIFSILAEEWGFVGAFIVFTIFIVIFIRSFYIVFTAKDDYGALIASGVLGMIFFHFTVNVGMAMGIMPITGIPLFFLSYGGSSLWTVLISISLLLNIHMRRYRY